MTVGISKTEVTGSVDRGSSRGEVESESLTEQAERNGKQ